MSAPLCLLPNFLRRRHRRLVPQAAICRRATSPFLVKSVVRRERSVGLACSRWPPQEPTGIRIVLPSLSHPNHQLLSPATMNSPAPISRARAIPPTIERTRCRRLVTVIATEQPVALKSLGAPLWVSAWSTREFWRETFSEWGMCSLYDIR